VLLLGEQRRQLDPKREAQEGCTSLDAREIEAVVGLDRARRREAWFA